MQRDLGEAIKLSIYSLEALRLFAKHIAMYVIGR